MTLLEDLINFGFNKNEIGNHYKSHTIALGFMYNKAIILNDIWGIEKNKIVKAFRKSILNDWKTFMAIVYNSNVFEKNIRIEKYFIPTEFNLIIENMEDIWEKLVVGQDDDTATNIISYIFYLGNSCNSWKPEYKTDESKISMINDTIKSSSN